MKKCITAVEAIDFLNSIFEIDNHAMFLLINSRVTCNEALAKHETVQVGKTDTGYEVGIIGILNGLFGANEKGYGYIMIEIDGESGRLRAYLTPER